MRWRNNQGQVNTQWKKGLIQMQELEQQCCWIRSHGGPTWGTVLISTVAHQPEKERETGLIPHLNEKYISRT